MTQLFNEALIFANKLHQEQVRKRWPSPYISHLLGVSALVMEYHGDETQAIAGLLHDSLEDQWTPGLDVQIKNNFGDDVFSIVRNCTDWYPGNWSILQNPEKPDWKTRKTYYLKVIPSLGMNSMLVIASDKLYNSRSIIKDFRLMGTEIFPTNNSKENIIWYYSSLLTTFQSIGLALWPIVQEFSRNVNELDLLIN